MAAINVAAHEIEFRGIRSGVHLIVTSNVEPASSDAVFQLTLIFGFIEMPLGPRY